MQDEQLKRSKTIRREVMSDEFVDRALDNASEFTGRCRT